MTDAKRLVYVDPIHHPHWEQVKSWLEKQAPDTLPYIDQPVGYREEIHNHELIESVLLAALHAFVVEETNRLWDNGESRCASWEGQFRRTLEAKLNNLLS